LLPAIITFSTGGTIANPVYAISGQRFTISAGLNHVFRLGWLSRHRSHSALKGKTPIETAESCGVNLKSYRWQKHCRGLYEMPTAA